MFTAFTRPVLWCSGQWCFIAAATGLALLLGGCGNGGSKIFETKDLGETRVIGTSAEIRLVISTPVTYDKGRIKPKRVICAEPSPDIVKAVQSAFGFGASLGVNIIGQGSGQGALSISDARAESAAQLGERLATIQLLRDGLYRACEAYANGAFSEVTYAVLLSRYDDTMISMLMGELAAGAFGRSLATLSGSAVSSASAEGELDSTLDIVKTANETAAQTAATSSQNQKEVDEAEADLKRKEGELEKDKAQDPAADHSQKEQEVADAKKEVDETKAKLKIANKTAANAKATAAAVAAGAISNVPNDKIAEILHKMQRKYMENINADALVVACITAMSRDDAKSPSALSKLCGETKENGGILATVVSGHHALLMELKRRASIVKSVETIESAKKALDNAKNVLGLDDRP